MSRYHASGDEHVHRPVMWWRGYPLWAAHFVVIVIVLSMVVTTALLAFRIQAPLSWLGFSNTLVLQGQVWRIFTYGLHNVPSLGFAFDMVYLVWFGREVERIFGRRKFLALFGAIYLLPPLVFTPLGFVLPVVRVGETGALGVFVAFATYFPEVGIFLHLTAKWCAWILVGIFSLAALAANDWAGLIWLWLACGFAYQWVRYQKGLFGLPDLRFWRRKPAFRVLPELAKKPAISARPEVPPPDASMAEIDALLDKIARSGLGSLTAKEREKLERGRDAIRRRSGDSR